MKKNKMHNILRIVILVAIFFPNTICFYLNSSEPDVITQYSVQSFREYLNQVGKNNLSYISEKYNIAIADAEVISQKVLPDPEISFEVYDNGELYNNHQMGRGFNIGLGYTIELGHKRGARVDLAKSQAELERLNVEAFFQELRAEAAKAYIEAMMQKDLLDVKRSSYEYMHQLSISDSIRFRLGEINENEARQSKIEAGVLLNEVYQQEAEYKSALVLLNQYMGGTFSISNLSFENWIVFDKTYDLANLITTALDNRIDLLATSKNTEVAKNGLKLVKAERKIDLGVSLAYGVNKQVLNEEAPTPAFNSLTAGVSIPLKFSNRNKGGIKAAQYTIEKSKVDSRNINLQIQTEVSQAFFNYEACQKQIKQFKSGLLADSQKLLDGVVYKYKRGETNILDVLIAQRTYNEIQEQYLESLKTNASALTDVQKACGIWDIEF